MTSDRLKADFCVGWFWSEIRDFLKDSINILQKSSKIQKNSIIQSMKIIIFHLWNQQVIKNLMLFYTLFLLEPRLT